MRALLWRNTNEDGTRNNVSEKVLKGTDVNTRALSWITDHILMCFRTVATDVT